jgi:ribonucleotide reductase alpha subunit
LQEVVRLSWIPPLETYPQFDDNALCILKERYLRHNPETGKQENPDEMFWRVASFVAGKSCELRART